MAKKTWDPSSWAQPFANNIYKQQAAGDEAQAAPYRAALEKATYAQLGPQFSQGLDKITNYLAGQGPLADSGARQALSSRLASGIYNTASGQIGGKYADYLAQIANQRRQYQYQMALQKQQQKDARKFNWASIPGAITGAAVGAYKPGGGGSGGGYGSDMQDYRAY